MSIIRRPGAAGGATSAVARYLHDLTLGSPVSDVQGSLLAASMGSNGLRIQLQDGAGATPLTLPNAVLWSWPLPNDVLGKPVTTLNLGERLVQAAVLERDLFATPLPINMGFVIGLCEGANPAAAAGEGFAAGLEYLGTTLRSVVAHRKLAGTWTRTIATAGQATCFGAEWTNNRHAITNVANNKVLPLDANFAHGTAGSNIVDVSTTITNIDAIDRLFVGAYWTSTAAGTPEARWDASLQILPFVAHQ